MWLEFGHSATDKTGLEFSTNIEMYTNKASSVVWIPFVVLAMCIVLSILSLVKTKQKQKVELCNLTNEINTLKVEIAKINKELDL